uniref:Large ribosomal subunit protein P1 n=1 Tax=Loxodonta africana TaxID=9785 RepID=G3T9P3_LOXAF
MPFLSELPCVCLAPILHSDEVTVTEDKINAPIKAASVNVEPFWPGLFAKALANVNTGSLVCKVGGRPAPAAAAAPWEGLPPCTAAARLRRRKWKQQKVEPKESMDDVGFGLFD